jgi:hypothetical protein
MAESSTRVGRGRANSRQADAEEEQWEVKAPVKPADQLQLTAEELNVEYTRILKANNPAAPHNIIRFNFKVRSYSHETDFHPWPNRTAGLYAPIISTAHQAVCSVHLSSTSWSSIGT